MKRKVITTIVTPLFVALFAYTALSKLLDYQQFRIQLGQSPVITTFAPVFAWLVPAVEIVVVILLIIPATRLFALYTSFALMSAFTAYIITITQFSEFVPCSCGGVLEGLGWTEHLIFNIVFMLLAVVGIVFHRKDDQHQEVPNASRYT